MDLVSGRELELVAMEIGLEQSNEHANAIG